MGAQCGEETPGDTGGNGGNWGLGGHQPVIMVTSSDVSIWANVPHEPLKHNDMCINAHELSDLLTSNLQLCEARRKKRGETITIYHP